MSDTNVVVLVGRLTRDAEMSKTKADKYYCKLRLAYSTWGGSENVSCFIGVTVWGKTAENLARYLVKGTRIAVVGSLTFSEWETRDGAKRSEHSISARDIQLLGDKKPSDSADAVAEALDAEVVGPAIPF